MEPFEETGWWWLPSQPQHRISGTLKYHPIEGIALELIGSFPPLGLLDRVQEQEIVLGITSSGKPVTLLECFESSAKVTFGTGLSTSTVVSNFILLGGHFERVNEIAFSDFFISYFHLNDWVRINPFADVPQDIEAPKPFRHIVSYTFPDEIHLQIGELDIALTYSFSSEGKWFEELHWKHNALFKISSNTPIEFGEFKNRINYLLQGFLCLGLGRATRPIFIRAKLREMKNQVSDESTNERQIDIYYTVNELPQKTKSLHAVEMNFCLPDIRDSFETSLAKWFDNERTLRPVYDLYLANLNSTSILWNHVFLNLIQALESYHRRAHNRFYLGDAEFQTLRKALISAIPPEIDMNYKSVVIQKLEYLNDLSLRSRLGELLEMNDSNLGYLFVDRDKFVDRVVATRNYLIHFSKDLESKVLRNLDLYRATQKLRVLLEVCLFREIGLPDDKISQLIKRNIHTGALAKE